MDYKNKRKWIIRAYIIILCLMLMIPIVIIFTRTGQGHQTYENLYVDISNEWSLKDGEEPISCKKFGKNMDAKEGVLNVYYQLPEQLPGNCIMFRSKDVYVSVYCEDEMIYETRCYDSPLYNKSPGNMWNTILLKNEYAGKTLRMEIKMVYDTRSVCVDNIRMGEKMNIVIGFAMSKVLGIVISLALIVLGFTLAVINLYSLFDKNMPRSSNFSLAATAIVIGTWCFIETNVLQVYMDDGRLLQLIDNMCMFIGLLPMVLYIDSFYKILKHRLIRVLCWADVVLLVACFVAQITDVSDFHHWIAGAWILFGIFILFMVPYVAMELWKRKKNHTLEIAHVLHIVGFILMSAVGIIPGMIYLSEDALDRAKQIRFGVFLFVICSAIGNQIQNSRKMGKAIKYEFVSKLAYKDGLTGLNNRTSYLEKISEYERNDISKLGIVFLDINNLKTINDQYGHSTGDAYITAVASAIEESFGQCGHAYRIGGDEFCVFIEGISLEEIFNDANEKFEKLVASKKEEIDCEVPMDIARGFEIYKNNGKNTLQEMIDMADEKMYENKARMKGL